MLDQERYNQEIEEIKQNVDQALLGCNIDERYRDDICNAVYNSVYGFKVAVAEPYGIDMEHIYSNLKYLSCIEENGDVMPRGAKGLCCYIESDENGAALREERPAAIYISPEISGDKDYLQRVISHELIHLYSFDYASQTRNLRGASMVEECSTESINDKVLNAISIEGKIQNASGDCRFADSSDSYIKSYSGGYHNIVPLYPAITTVYPEEELIRIKFGAQQPYNNDRQNGLNSLSMDLEKINNGLAIEDYGMFYRNLSNQLFDSYKRNNDFSHYLEDAKRIGENSPQVAINGFTYRISDIAFEMNEVTYLYHNSFGHNSVKNNSDVIARTVECQDFLRALSIAKQSDVDFSFRDFMEAKTARTMHNGEPSVAIQMGGHTYVTPQTNGTNNVVCGVGNRFSEESVTVKPGFHLASKNNDGSNFVLLSQMTASFNGGFTARWDNTSEGTLISASTGVLPSNPNTLVRAIEKNDVSAIHDSSGHNLLHGAAASVAGITFMKTLRETDPKIFASMLREKDNNGITPIDIACSNLNMYALRYIAESTTFQKEDTSHLFDKIKINGQEKRPIVEIMKNDEKLACCMLTAIGNEKVEGTTLLHGAVYLKSQKMINAIGSNGIDLKDENGQTALNKLICSNEPTEVKRNLSLALLENGANPNIVSNNGASPLAIVIQGINQSTGQDRENYMSIFKDLLEHGADPNQKMNVKIGEEEKEMTPGQVALQMHKFDTFELMAQSTEVANIDERQNAPTLTEALPCVEMLDTMVNFGMDVMMKTRDFESVIEFADGTGGLAIIEAVMKGGAGIEQLTEMISASGSFDGIDTSSLVEAISNNASLEDIESIISGLDLADVDRETLNSIISDCIKEIEEEMAKVAEEEELEAEEEMVLSLEMFNS